MTAKVLGFTRCISRPAPNRREAHGASQIPYTMLLVDDDVILLQALAETLRFMGIAVLEAASPREAIHIFSERYKDIDLLMVDIQMPEMDGWTLASRIRSTQRKIPILYMSGGVSIDEWERHPERIVDSRFLAKPFLVNDLKNIIEEICKRKVVRLGKNDVSMIQ